MTEPVLAAGRPRRDDAMRQIDRMAEMCGTKRPAAIAIVGEMDFSLERNVRRAIARAWNAPAIQLQIRSHGGLAHVGSRIARDLQQIGVPVSAHADVLCASAAVRPFIAASRRTAHPKARFVLHASTLDVADVDLTAANARTLRELADYAESIDRDYLTDLQAKVRLAPNMIQQMQTGDLTLGSWMARQVGLVHEITPAPPPDRFAARMRLQPPAAARRSQARTLGLLHMVARHG